MSRKNRLLSARINAFFKKDEWEKARDLLIGELKKSPNDHWLLARLATTYYEQKLYKKALRHLETAKSIAPNCPLVLWEIAGCLDMLGKEHEAIKVYGQILLSYRSRDKDLCWESPAWSNSMLADSFYRIGLCYQDLGKTKQATSFLSDYLELRSIGFKSIYSIPQARSRIKALTSAIRNDFVAKKLKNAESQMRLAV